MKQKNILVTGSSGFIGFHLSEMLLNQGHKVIGVDNFSNYYDVNLKHRRNSILLQNNFFQFVELDITDSNNLFEIFSEKKVDIIVHLAAQAGVRYSLENPRSYIDTNLVGTFNIMELARHLAVQHLLMASTSSVYGANDELPFTEDQKTDRPLTLYAATKKANEIMAHSYSHLWKIPTTMMRFFTVYGPYGRPDLALFKFTKAMLENEPIDIYNNGEMMRDFTYVTDLVTAITKLIDCVPGDPSSHDQQDNWTVAPYRTLNIGNGELVPLMKFIEAIEQELGVTAKKNFMPMQKGDVQATWADNSSLLSVTEYSPKTSYRDGVSKFIEWYRSYYGY